ncbi:MAG: hypothetical protein WC319_06020 [Candidatus Paceibacterota bacterium]|jgi:hypothetical protein
MDISQLREKYRRIEYLLSTIDFSLLWPNFIKYPFALYDDTNVVFEDAIFAKTNDFIGNTSIMFQNRNTAIWNMNEDIDEEVLTSKIVHEMFHAFQNDNHENRYPKEIEALYKYQYDIHNLSNKFNENKLIVSLSHHFTTENFTNLLNMKSQRNKINPYEFSYEAKVEQIEGTAQYVELKALESLNIVKAEKLFERLCNNVVNPKNLFPIRIISYDCGALYIKLLIDNRIPFESGFSNTTINEQLVASLKPILTEVIDNPEIKMIYDSYSEETKRLIKDALTLGKVVAKGNYKLIGVNVYSARYDNNCIYSEYFVAYEDEVKDNVLYGNYVIKMHKDRITEIYQV